MLHYLVRCVFVISFQHLEDVGKTIDYIFFVLFFRLSSLVVRAWNLGSINGRTRCARKTREGRETVTSLRCAHRSFSHISS